MPGTFIGIDIGSKYTKVTVIEQTVKFHLSDGFMFSTPMKAAKDGDKSVDPDAFMEEMKKFISLPKLRSSKIAINVPPMSITALSVFLPLMSKKELAFAAINEAKQKMIPVSGPNHIFDCQFLGEVMINKIPRAEAQVIRTEKVFVQRILDLFKAAETYPRLITPASTAIPVILPKEAWKKDEAVAVVDLGAAYLKIAICRDEDMVFVRNIVYGLDDIIQDFSRQLTLDSARVEKAVLENGVPDVPFDPKDKVAIAEEIMRQKYEASMENGTPMEVQLNTLELRLLWQPHIEKIAQELRRSAVFYKEQSEGRKIEKVFFIGGGSALKNLIPLLSGLVSGECKVLLPFAHMQYQLASDNKFKNEIVSTPLFVGSTSLALSLPIAKGAKRRQLNFLPTELRQREVVAARRLGFLIAAICCIGIFILLTIHVLVSNQLLSSQVRELNQKLSKVKRVSDNLKAIEKNQNQIAQRSAQIDELLKKRPDLARPLRDIAAAASDDMLFGKATVRAGKVDLEGLIDADYEQAGATLESFKEKLERLPYLSNVVVVPLEAEQFSPQANPRGAAGELVLTEKKQRKFSVSADIAAQR